MVEIVEKTGPETEFVWYVCEVCGTRSRYKSDIEMCEVACRQGA